MTSMLPHHENDLQQSINNFRFCILGNEVITQILELITELLTAFIDKKTKYTRNNLDSKIINIANCIACVKTLLDVE